MPLQPLRAPAPLALAVALALVVVAAAGALVLRDPAPAAGPAPVSASPSSRAAVPSASALRPPRPVLAGGAAGAPPSAAGLARSLATGVRSAALGGGLAGIVLDTAGGTRYAVRADDLLPPASTAKLATGVAALTALGADARLTTRTVLAGRTVVLVGGGDPTLALRAGGTAFPKRASLDALAAATARALRVATVPAVALRFDPGRYVGPTTAAGWKPGYLTDGDVARVSALMVDGGRVRPASRARVADPAGAAARAFATRLTAYGVRVAGPPRPAAAPPAARPLAAVSSPPMADLVEEMLTTSDNDLAEALAREVAGRYGLPRSFAGAAAGVRRGVAKAGVDPAGLVLADGSGLSTRNRARPRTTAALLLAATRQPALRPVLTGLPVAGFSGTLTDRYRTGPPARAAGLIRAKTGTLTGVSALAGLLRDRDGAVLLFALVAAGVGSTSRASAGLDRLTGTLAACGCR